MSADIHRRITAALAACAVVLALASCSFSASTSGKSVKKADVEKQVSDQVAAKAGKPQSVTCPGNLKAKVGTTMRCSLVDRTGVKYGLRCTVTAVEGSTVSFGIKIDDKPTP